MRPSQSPSPSPQPRSSATPEETYRFAFVVHPLSLGFIHRHRAFGWTRWLPDALVESAAAWLPPSCIGRITGGRSPATGQRIEGLLYSIAATPRQMMDRAPEFTYRRLLWAARMAERAGARILGLGAFTKVVGDAGLTVSRLAPLPVTSGNSLTIAATLEAAKQAVRRMGVEDLTRGRVMIVGATGAIGSVCSRLLARAVKDVVLVSIEPERLESLKATILAEVPDARVVTALETGDLLDSCDLIITATSAFAQRVLDISRCKPGAVICDVALPADIPPEEAALRPDVLVVEGGEVLIPGEVTFSYDLGLPPGVAYACLGEAALLAMDGRFECYTVGRDIDAERVKEIYRLFQKHRFQLAGLRSCGRYLTAEDFAAKRSLAARLRDDPELFAEVRADAAAALAKLPPKSKGVSQGGSAAPYRDLARQWAGPAVAAGLLGALGVAALSLKRRRRRRAPLPERSR